MPVFFAFLISILGVQEGVKGSPSGTLSLVLTITILIAAFLVSLSVYISIQAIKGSSKYELVRSTSTYVCVALGTDFRGANLTDADFSQAKLPHTNFRKSVLQGTYWLQAKKLDLSLFEGTYLEDLDIRDLVVSRDGSGNNYDYKNLQGLNLKAVKLLDTSFIGADLSGANLQNADLRRAKLVKTRLYGANLTQSCITGACIQDWAISTDTQLRTNKMRIRLHALANSRRSRSLEKT